MDYAVLPMPQFPRGKALVKEYTVLGSLQMLQRLVSC
jgi:hypothetical protein